MLSFYPQPGKNGRWTRFLETTLGTGVRPSDIFIVGHPKSGMTWMEFLLSYAILERENDNAVTFRTQYDYVPDLSAVGPRDPLFLGCYAGRPAPRVFFTHTPSDPRLLRGRVVYVLRDPRDVLVSYYHHHRRRVQGFNLSLSAFVRKEDTYPCPWDVHVRGWLEGPRRERIFVVRYEELRADTAGGLAQILQFCAVPHTPANIERAVRLSDFKRMKEVEQAFPENKPVYEKGATFVRRGKVGGWRDELSAADIAYLQERLGPTMKAYGYEPVELPQVVPSATAEPVLV